MHEYLRICEGLLFLAGSEGVSSSQLSAVLEKTITETEQIMIELQQELEDTKRGLRIIRVSGNFQLTTCAEHIPYFEKFAYVPETHALSKAALETLSIVAYRQPITRVEIEEIRGVKCDRSLQTLQTRQLIEDIGRAEAIGRPILYATTANFLTYFGINALTDLPPLPEFNEEEELQLTQSLFDRVEDHFATGE